MAGGDAHRLPAGLGRELQGRRRHRHLGRRSSTRPTGRSSPSRTGTSTPAAKAAQEVRRRHPAASTRSATTSARRTASSSPAGRCPSPTSRSTASSTTPTRAATSGASRDRISTALSGLFLKITDDLRRDQRDGRRRPRPRLRPHARGTDCVVPAGHSVGDTNSSRSGFYELNRLIEQAQGHLRHPTTPGCTPAHRQHEPQPDLQRVLGRRRR